MLLNLITNVASQVKVYLKLRRLVPTMYGVIADELTSGANRRTDRHLPPNETRSIGAPHLRGRYVEHLSKVNQPLPNFLQIFGCTGSELIPQWFEISDEPTGCTGWAILILN